MINRCKRVTVHRQARAHDMARPNCDGTGMCLSQRHDGGYDRATECAHDCQPIKCPNYAVCGNERPRCILDCYGGVCAYCKMMFGVLTIAPVAAECPICYVSGAEQVLLVCGHHVCASCFSTQIESEDDEPQEEDYGGPSYDPEDDEGSDTRLDEWRLTMPDSAARYDQAHEEWSSRNHEKLASRRWIFGKCPICRARMPWTS